MESFLFQIDQQLSEIGVGEDLLQRASQVGIHTTVTADLVTEVLFRSPFIRSSHTTYKPYRSSQFVLRFQSRDQLYF